MKRYVACSQPRARTRHLRRRRHGWRATREAIARARPRKRPTCPRFLSRRAPVIPQRRPSRSTPHRQHRSAVEPGVPAEGNIILTERCRAGCACCTERQAVRSAGRRVGGWPSPGAEDIVLLDVVLVPASPRTVESFSASSITLTARTPTRASPARGSTRTRSRSARSPSSSAVCPDAVQAPRLRENGGTHRHRTRLTLLMTLGDRSDSPPGTWRRSSTITSARSFASRRRLGGHETTLRRHARGIARDLGVRRAAPKGSRSIPDRALGAERSRPARGRRAEHRRERQELRLADRRARHRLSGQKIGAAHDGMKPDLLLGLR